MSARTSHLDDVEVDRSFEGDGKSTIDLYEVPGQLGQPDGESTVELPDTYIGRERVIESVENAAGDNTLVYTSEPTHSKLSSAFEQDVKDNVDPPVKPFPAASVENLASGEATLDGQKGDATNDANGGNAAVAGDGSTEVKPKRTYTRRADKEKAAAQSADSDTTAGSDSSTTA